MGLSDASSQTELLDLSPEVAGHAQQEQIIKPLPGHCSFYVQRKKRFCRMSVRLGAQYCGEHSPLPQAQEQEHKQSLRVPCPYDPKHTCFATKMEKHLKICNSKPPSVVPEYLVPGVNSGEGQDIPAVKGSQLTINSVSDEKLINIIGQLMATYKRYVDGEIPMESLDHPCMEDELGDPTYGPGLLKHLIQNSSLLGQMEKVGLLDGCGTTFVEFGSGRGQLSYWLTKAVHDPTQCQFILVDRASQRHKFDNRLKDSEDLSLVRLKVDIGDLVLGRVRPYVTEQKEGVVGVSKHLCGAATDLALRCLTNTLQEARNPLKGLVIALCCHHRCTWNSYVGKEFLKSEGFTPEDFPLLSSITSWCTCGSGRPRKRQHGQREASASPSLGQRDMESPGHEGGDNQTVEVNKANTDRYSKLQLDQATREEIGRQAKRVLDYGRLRYLESRTDLDVKLKYYCDPYISLENALIVCSPPQGATG